MQAELIGLLKPCITYIYIQIFARMADYIRTHPYIRNVPEPTVVSLFSLSLSSSGMSGGVSLVVWMSIPLGQPVARALAMDLSPPHEWEHPVFLEATLNVTYHPSVTIIAAELARTLFRVIEPID